MPTLAIVAEADPLTEHLVLLIIAIASAGVLLLIILLAVMFWGSAKRSRVTPGREPAHAHRGPRGPDLDLKSETSPNLN